MLVQTKSTIITNLYCIITNLYGISDQARHNKSIKCRRDSQTIHSIITNLYCISESKRHNISSNCRRDSQIPHFVLSNVQSILKITDRKWFTCIAIVVILFEEPSSLDLSIWPAKNRNKSGGRNQHNQEGFIYIA